MTRVRLQRYLSQAGVAARRKAESLIVDGRVRINGRVVTELGTSVDPAVDRVTVDGQAAYPQEPFYCILNKPKGTITAVSDPQGRPTVMEFLPNLPVEVKPVGRLDFYSEGVLLLTNDGELSAALQSPQSHVEKTYHVKFRGQVSEAHMEAMRRGVRLDDGVVTRPAQVDRLRAKSRHDWLVITLTEGKSRQIHRMAEALGHQVVKLQRVAFAGLDYFGLRVGDARELTQAELNGLRELVGLPRNPSAAARGAWRSRREDSDLSRRARERQREAGEDAAGPAPTERSAARADAVRDRPIERPRARTGERPRDRSTDRPRDRSADRPRDRSADRPRDRSIDRPRDRSGGRAGDRSRARGAGPSLGRAADRARGDGPGRGRASDRSRARGAGPSFGRAARDQTGPRRGRGGPVDSRSRPGGRRGGPVDTRSRPGGRPTGPVDRRSRPSRGADSRPTRRTRGPTRR
jgi:23S rRNA pseudouridine2605 synthase